MSIRIAIVEDQVMVAEMLKVWLKRRPQFEVVGCAGDGVSALALCRAQRPDVATVDIELPAMDGLELSQQLLLELPALKIIILTCRANPYCLLRAEELGVHGYVDKMSPLPLLEKAVRAVAAGERFFSDPVRNELDRQERKPDAFNKILTEREQDILGLLSTGMSDQEIGTRLNISPDTVWTHRRNLRRKLNINDDRKLMQYARELGLDFSANNLHTASPGQPNHRKGPH